MRPSRLRSSHLYVEEMLHACQRAIRYTRNLTKSDLVADDRTFDAVIRCLTVIGEAAKGVPDSLRSRYPQVPWKAAAGLRDRVVHHYFGIDQDVVWDVVENHLVPLQIALEVALESWPDDKSNLG
jgi:uncharacterized protein with HEPN domain